MFLQHTIGEGKEKKSHFRKQVHDAEFKNTKQNNSLSNIILLTVQLCINLVKSLINANKLDYIYLNKLLFLIGKTVKYSITC